MSDRPAKPDCGSSDTLSLDELIDSLVASHLALVDDLPYAGASGSLTATRALVADEFAALERRLTGEEDGTRLARLKDWLEQELARLAPYFAERSEPRLSWVVGRPIKSLCHQQRLVMVNALDLDPSDPAADRRLDRGFDIVSLLVGLYVRGETRLAHYALDRYLRLTGDYALTRLISVFAVCRSLGGARRALQRWDTGAETQAFHLAEMLTECRQYLDLAERVSEFRFPPLIIGVGVSGSGKSRFMAEVVERLGAVRLSSDAERRRLYGIDPQVVASTPPVDIFSEQATERTYHRLAALSGVLLNAGIATCVDATCLTRAQRRLLRQQGEARGLPVLIVSFEADDATLVARIVKRARDQAMDETTSLEVLRLQQGLFEAFDDEERQHLVHIDTTAENATDTLAALIQQRVFTV